MEKKCNLLLRKHTRESFRLSYFGKDKSFWFLKAHDFVVLFQPEYGMLEKRNTVAIPVQKHRQIIVDVFLREIVRQLFKIQHSLRDFQFVIIDSTVRVLSQAEFLSKQRYTLPEFGYSSNRPVQCVVGHGVLWCRGLMTGLVQGLRHLPAPLDRNEKNK